MTFNNPVFFLIYLPLCVAGFALFGRFGRRPAVGFLAFMSLVFYAAWSPVYLLLLIASILWNFFVARRIAAHEGNEPAQNRWLIAGIAVNLSALVYFKYLFPVIGFVGALVHTGWSVPAVILPLGISFFTFTQIAYLVDLKQGAAQTESLLTYVFFVTFFPHLVAGPILHNRDMMPQVREERRYFLNSADVALGLTWFGMGLFKKVVADHIEPGATLVFNQAHTTGARGAWIGALTYVLQLYFDFSGYSDMAVGLARIFSIRFPFNFNSPYKATSIIDFWQRWHMTLTQYIMSYVYSPLLMSITRRRRAAGKKNTGPVRTTAEGFFQLVALPTSVTLLLAGVWHGAGLQYVLYGAIHSVLMTINYAWRTFVPEESAPRRFVKGPVAVAITFFCVVLALVAFRSAGLTNAWDMYKAMFGAHGFHDAANLREVAKIAALLAVVWLLPNTQEILGEHRKNEEPSWSLVRTAGFRATPLWWAAACVALFVGIAYSSASTTFLYFQF